MRKTVLHRIIVIILAMVLSNQLYAQTPEAAPLNPDFIRYLELREQGLWRNITDEGYGLGHIPSPFQFKFSDEVPEDFRQPPSFDLRTLGGVTSVKNQGDCGSCWAFATMGASESMLIYKGLGTYDLSENNLKQTHGFFWTPCQGGNSYISTAYLSRGSGPMYESDDPYYPSDFSAYNGNPPAMYITDAVFLPNNMNIIKQAIQTHGALYTVFYWDEFWYNSSNFTYYYPGTLTHNHAVALVGWDNSKVTAGGVGAWIAKNSWGTGWGQAGYFYIAYQDTKVNSEVTYWPNKIDYSSTRVIEYYDHLGATGSAGYSSTTGYALVKYVAAQNYNLLKLGTFVVEDNTTIGFEVYDNFSGGVLSNLLGSISNQSIANAGYFTLDLPSQISISSGNDYYVKVYYNAPSNGWPIPTEWLVNNYAYPNIETGVCWISNNGSSWFQLGQNVSGFEWDVCVKAYGELYEEEEEYDFGDAPDGPYPTLQASGGPSHIIDGVTFLGYSVDAETDGQPNATATGDDNDGNNDDDGVTFTSLLMPGQMATVQVIASVPGILNAWIDFNQTNVWADPGEWIFLNLSLTAGINNLSFTVPATAVPGNTFARFRFSNVGNIGFYYSGGPIPVGEVEDYMVNIGDPGPDQMDFGDAPDNPYPTLLANNGARHLIVPGMYLGAGVDPEPDGQPDFFALGDDMAGNDDEDGVVFQNSFVRGQNVNIQVSVVGSGYINAWFDWDANGSWAGVGEHAIVDWPVSTGIYPYNLLVPPTANTGFTFARFRFSSTQGLNYDGLANDGEVEDYRILINEPEDHKMHYPQYPDPGGWDVNFSFPHRIGDDWMCTETGLVEDFHFWVSWKDDMVPEDFGVHFRLEIFSDIPANPDDPLSYSKPGFLLWDREFAPTMYAYELVFEHPQGWYDPFIPEHQIWDHNHCYRIDIDNFPDPFMQEEGTIYWLVITAVVPGGGGIVYEDFILTLDNIDPTTPAYQTWMEDLAILSIQDHPIAGPPPGFGFDAGGVWLHPAMLWVDLSGYAGKIINVEVDIIDYAGIGMTEAILYDGGTVVDSKQNITSGVPETLYLNNTGLAYHPDLLTISSFEGYVFEIRFTLELQGGDEYKIGWKTSPDHFLDVAVWESPNPDLDWEMLHDPVTGEPLSLSFIITGNPPDQPFDYGDAPEGALAYPASGVIGQFPTCMNVGPVGSFIQHNNFGAFFGPSIDFELDGNAGFCPTFNPNMYDQDECFNDGDAGLLVPDAFTITGSIGSEIVTPCPGSTGIPLGLACTQAVWGSNIDIHVQNLMPGNTTGYVNVIFDWDQSGHWGGVPVCPGGINAPEHVLVNFPVSNGFVGPLSGLAPPAFLIGPHAGHVWVRFSITELPVPLPWDGSGIFEDGETEDYLLLVESEIPPEPYEFGDAPEGALAYPASGVIGQFPTCMNVGPPGSYIQHNNFGAFFGPGFDFEPDGNAGFCPLFNPNTYNQDECFMDGDAGLITPGAFTIVGNPGAELVVPCPGSPPIPLGNVCTPAIWGGNIDIHVQNMMPAGTLGFVNVLIDWNQDGQWSGFSTCPDGTPVPEHILVDFPVPNGFVGALTSLNPPPFHIGPNSGYVWARISITEIPVGPGWNGSGIFEDGETEDYLLLVHPQENLDLQNITVPGGTTTCYEAANTITTGGGGTTFIMQNGATVYLVAGQSISMLPGTHFQSGSYVHAYIDQTGEFCSNPKAIIAEEEPEPETLPFEFTESESFFRIYPNPTKGQFTLELRDVTETSTIKVEIFSLIGESIMNVELPEMKQYLFDLSAKQPGIYLIRVMRGDKVGVQKVIRR